MSTYYFSRTLDLPMDEAVARVTDLLKEAGFGILTEIDVQATLKKKLDVDFRPYRILGACNPQLAHQALQHEPHIGVMLPCNVVVQETEGGTEVFAVDPVASMNAVENEALEGVADEVQQRLKRVIEQL